MTHKLRLSSIPIVLLVGFLALGEAVAAAPQRTPMQMAQQPSAAEVSTLELEQPIAGEIRPGQTQTYQLNLEAGQFVQIAVTQEGIDLSLLLFDSDGKQVGEIDLLTANQGEETLFWIAEIPGTYRLQIQPAEEAGEDAEGSYAVEIKALRRATERDRVYLTTRQRAEQLTEEASDLYQEGTEESQQQALLKAEEALTLWEELEDPLLKAWTALGLGIINVNLLQDHPAALPYYQRALPLFEALQNLPGQAQALELRGYTYFGVGEKSKVLADLRQAQQLYRQTRDFEGEARVQRQIGYFYRHSEDYPEALAAFQQALQQYRDLGNRVEQRNVLFDLGQIYADMGEKQLAIESWQQSIDVARELGLVSAVAIALEKIGELHEETGDRASALAIYQEAVPLYRQLENTGKEVEFLMKLGELHKEAGDLTAAIESYEQANQLYNQLERRWDEAFAFWKLSSIYFDISDYQQALDYARQALEIWQILEDRSWEANILHHIGLNYEQLGETQQAIAAYERSAQLQRQEGNQVAELLALDSLGSIHTKLGEGEKALGYFEQALQLANSIDEKDSAATILRNIGQVHFSRGETQKGFDYFEQGLNLLQEIGDRAGQSEMLFFIGTQYGMLGESQKALESFEQALALQPEGENSWVKAYILSSLASTYSDFQEYQKALEAYNQALAIMREIRNPLGEATILRGLGAFYARLNDYAQALDYHDRALIIYQEVGERGWQASTLSSLASIYYTLGDYQASLKNYEQALTLYQKTGERSYEAYAFNEIGNIYTKLGDYQQSLDMHNRALAIQREISDRSGEAWGLAYIAENYNDLGDSERSIDFYKQALEIYRAIGDLNNIAHTLDDIGEVYQERKEFATSLDYYQQSLAIWKKAEDVRGEGQALSQIGEIYQAQGEYQKALAMLEQAQSLYKQASSLAGQAANLTQIGRVYMELENYDRAIASFNESLTLSKTIGSRLLESLILRNFGKVYQRSGENQKSLEAYQQRLALLQEIGDKPDEAETLYNLAQVQRKLGNLQQAKTRIEAALEIVESLRGNVASQELRTSFFASKQEYYEFYIDLLMELHRQNPSQGYDAQALHASERGKARSLLELLTEANADIRQGVDPTLLEQEQTLQQKLGAIEQHRVELYSGTPTEQQKANLEKERESLIVQYREIQNQIRATSPKYAALTQPQPLTLDQIQQQVLDDDTLLLQYSLGEERSYLWLVSQDGIESYTLPPRQEIEVAAREFYRLLRNPRYGYRLRPAIVRGMSAESVEAVSKISQMLLGQVLEKLGNKRLLIVSDGALQYVPFAALPLPGTEEDEQPTPLITQNEIVHLPSTSTLGILRKETQGRTPAPKQLALLADPVFSFNDKRLRGEEPRPALNSDLNQRLVNRSSRESDVGLIRLPGTRQEAEAIMALVPESERTQVFDFAANRDFATNEELSQYRIIHLATHGILNSQNPELSGIVLSLVDEQGNPQNGFLRLHDVFNLNLPAELVVLSACQTGLGEEVQGEGLVGLTRGFMYAGAPRVLVSLWSVDDAATAELMTRFYRLMLKEGQPPTAALRQAQLEMQTETQWKNPYYWAAFTLQGEWR